MTDTVSSLYKFCPPDTGLKILTSQSLRWSAPHLLADPFELDYRSDPELTTKDLLDELLREALIILFGPDEPIGRSNRLINVMARWRDQQKFIDEEQAREVLQDLLGQIAKIQIDTVQDYLKEWRRFASTVRVACFSEAVDSLSCWDRFTDNHTGLALRFECGDDTALPAPRRVTYAAAAPVITHKREQLEVIYGRRSAPVAAEFDQKLLVKSRHQQGEMEWRCFDSDIAHDTDADPSLWYVNKRFPAHELRAVYCGAQMPAASRDQIARLLRGSFPSTRLYQVQPAAGRYELEFVSIARS